MEDKKEILKKELEQLKEKFGNIQDMYINYYHIIGKAKGFVYYYEGLLKEKSEKYNNMLSIHVTMFVLIMPIFCYFYYDFLFRNSEIMLNNEIISLLIFSFPCCLENYKTKEIIKEIKELKKMKMEIKEKKSEYEKQKELIPIYIKERDYVGIYLTDLMDKIDAKKVELFQLNENTESVKQPHVEKIYTNPFIEYGTNNNIETSNKELKIKTLVHKK